MHLKLVTKHLLHKITHIPFQQGALFLKCEPSFKSYFSVNPANRLFPLRLPFHLSPVSRSARADGLTHFTDPTGPATCRGCFCLLATTIDPAGMPDSHWLSEEASSPPTDIIRMHMHARTLYFNVSLCTTNWSPPKKKKKTITERA